jgi:hypothetical protein
MKITKQRLNQIIQEEYDRILLEQGGVGPYIAGDNVYATEHPSGLGYEQGTVDRAGNIIGSSQPYTDEDLRDISLYSGMKRTRDPDFPDEYLSSDSVDDILLDAALEEAGYRDQTGAHVPWGYPIAPQLSRAYTPSPARIAHGYTPVRPRTLDDAEFGVPGMQGRGYNRQNESLTRQIERYVKNKKRGAALASR